MAWTYVASGGECAPWGLNHGIKHPACFRSAKHRPDQPDHGPSVRHHRRRTSDPFSCAVPRDTQAVSLEGRPNLARLTRVLPHAPTRSARRVQAHSIGVQFLGSIVSLAVLD